MRATADLLERGGALARSGRLEEALEAHREAVRLEPSRVEALVALGDTALMLARIDEARAVFARAVELDPSAARAHHGLGRVLAGTGDLAAAADRHRTAFELDPTLGGAALGLARARRFASDDDEDIALLERALERGELSGSARADLHFALGKALDDCGRFDAAFAHYREGNRLVTAEERFPRERLREGVTKLIGTFSRAFFAARAGAGVSDETPVFVVGMPRSGTTLVEQILAGHPEAHGAGELGAIDALARGVAARAGARVRYPQSALLLDGPMARELAGEYLAALRALAPGARRVVDKMPANFFHLGFIATLFPRATIVHCRRAALDLCLSIYFQQFERGHAWAYDLADIAYFCREYRRLMRHWRSALPIPIHDVWYEGLVRDPERGARALLAAAGLGWDPRCLEFHRAGRPVLSASGAQVREPPHTRSVRRWRHYEAHLGDFPSALRRQ